MGWKGVYDLGTISGCVGNLLDKLYYTSLCQAHSTWHNSDSPCFRFEGGTETEKELKSTHIPNPIADCSLQCVKYHVPDKIRYHNIYVDLYSSLQRDVNKPLKFFITSFLADPGLLLANGDACLLNPLLGLLRAEKLALFCVSAISVVTSSCLSFLVCDDLFWFSDECLRFFMWLFSLFSLCSCKGALAAFERGIHTFDLATRMANKVSKYLQKSLFITKLSRSWIPVTKIWPQIQCT